MSRIRFSGRIKSLQYSGHAHYSDTIECDPNYRNATHERKYECLAAFCEFFKVII